MSVSRFSFGKNWQSFLGTVTDAHVCESMRMLEQLVGNLSGKTFLDVGTGSGLSSLAAVRLGAARVHGFDFDPDSVACSLQMKERFAPNANWTVERGSALDPDYLATLGKFDAVYSWGVLHHTGDMWRALDLVTIPLAPDGVLAIALYNDQGIVSSLWRAVKRAYDRVPVLLRPLYVVVVMAPHELLRIAARGPIGYLRMCRNYKTMRGMNMWHDLVDWVGGYPFEVAAPDRVFTFYREHGFSLERLKTCGGKLGCNEYVFRARS